MVDRFRSRRTVADIGVQSLFFITGRYERFSRLRPNRILAKNQGASRLEDPKKMRCV
jgi:hypothetical protein